ncbi:YidH family protein [Methanooceanicella nereidis]|uniref:YidH family protein n=1 Tax=Methanooceanicella nereidis TaxID=2052831 RepID=UPI001E62206E
MADVGPEHSEEEVKDQIKLAHERTFLAKERNLLANERTLSAWIRTGLSLVAVALALPRLLELSHWLWALRIIGVVFITTATVVFVIAYRSYSAINRKLTEEGVESTPTWVLKIVILALLLCNVLALLLLFQEQ